MGRKKSKPIYKKYVRRKDLGSQSKKIYDKVLGELKRVKSEGTDRITTDNLYMWLTRYSSDFADKRPWDRKLRGRYFKFIIKVLEAEGKLVFVGNPGVWEITDKVLDNHGKEKT